MKRISIMGDSISTFKGCNPDDYLVYYTDLQCETTGVCAAKDTWWAQVIEQLGGKLCKNISFSGSMVQGADFPAGNCDKRVADLAKDGEAPDTIIIFIGINDYGWGTPEAQARGRGGAVPHVLNLEDFPEAIAGVAPKDAAKRFSIAYSEMLARIRTAYPQAEAWCCTLVPGRVVGKEYSTFAYRLRGVHFDQYCEAIRYAAGEQGCKLADIRALGYDYEASDGTHPTKQGMKQLAHMMLRAMEIEQSGVQVPGNCLRANAGESGFAVNSRSRSDDAPFSLAESKNQRSIESLCVSKESKCQSGHASRLQGFSSEEAIDAPRSQDDCKKPVCIDCKGSTNTGNKWSCVCRRNELRSNHAK